MSECRVSREESVNHVSVVAWLNFVEFSSVRESFFRVERGITIIIP